MSDPLALLTEQAAFYQTKLSELKQHHAADEFPWYPYDSIGNFCLLEKFVQGERRDFLRLFGEGPVLDLCCADGDLSFFLESLGCTVHAVDYPVTNMNFMRGIERMKQVLESKVEIHTRRPRFAVPASGTVLHHGLLLWRPLPSEEPFYVLEELAKHVEWCFLNTRVAKYMPDQKTLVQGFPVAYLVGPEELNGDYSNYWIFSEAGLRRIVDRAQWDVCDIITFGNSTNSDPVRADCDERAFCLLRSRVLSGGLSVRLLEGWHELEDDTWRWTARRFALRLTGLRAVAGRLVLPFVLAEPVLGRGPFKLSATANGQPLPTQVYHSAGPCQYVASLSGLEEGKLDLSFEASLALPPDPSDKRERALIIKPSDLRTVLQS